MLKYLLLNVKSYFVLKLKNLILNFHLQIYFQRLCMNHNQFSITWYPSAATIYDQPNNESFCNLTEKVQHNAALAKTGAIKGTSQLKIYNEFGH